MPRVPAVPPGTRIFGRLDHFLVECPACGELIGSNPHGRTPSRLATLSRARAAAKAMPHNPQVKALVYNPYSQRLCCPHCDTVYVCGILLYTVAPRTRASLMNILPAPPDTVPERRQLVAMRAQARGWWRRKAYEPHEPVNLAVDPPCPCDPFAAPDPSCPIHGDQVVSAALPPK